MITIAEYKPLNIGTKLKDKICKLHQGFINLSRKKIIKNIEDKDLLYVFKDDETDDLAATTSIKWVHHKNTITAYIGSIVVSEKYQRKNFFSHVIFKTIMKTLLTFPTKKLFIACFVSNPKAYNYSTRPHIKHPHPNVKTPENIVEIMHNLAIEVAGKENFIATDDIFIIDYLQNADIKQQGIQNLKSNDGFFEKVNPDYQSGKQLMMIFPIPLNTICLYIAYGTYFSLNNLYHGAQESMTRIYQYLLSKIKGKA